MPAQTVAADHHGARRSRPDPRSGESELHRHRPRSENLVGDITYIHTWEGWLYLATVIDCFNKEVIGWSMADHMRTELVTDALDMAARNHGLAEHCIMHSDHGTQYTSAEFRAKLDELNL